MFSTALALAALAAFVTFLLHLIAGGRTVAAPLLRASDLPRVAKLTMYYCWHIVSLLLFLLSAALAYASLREPQNTALLLLCLALVLGCAVWSLALAVGTRSRLWHLPQWTLFLAIGAPIAWHLTRG
jgi:hypothetical protein